MAGVLWIQMAAKRHTPLPADLGSLNVNILPIRRMPRVLDAANVVLVSIVYCGCI
jgi:hypothetical protein